MSMPAVRARSHRARASLALLVVAVSIGGLATHAQAQPEGPVLHEFIDADAADTADLSRTDSTGQLPAAVQTPSGTITPPDIRTTPDPRRVYRDSDTGASNGSLSKHSARASSSV